jgi:nucleoid-associated protein YgaU
MHLHETTTRERVLKLDETEILEAIKAHYKLEDWDSYVLTVEKRDQGCGQGFKCEIQLRMRNNEPPAFHTVAEGDTLTAIALRYLGDADLFKRLVELNPELRNPSLIMPGQRIRLR